MITVLTCCCNINPLWYSVQALLQLEQPCPVQHIHCPPSFSADQLN